VSVVVVICSEIIVIFFHVCIVVYILFFLVGFKVAAKLSNNYVFGFMYASHVSERLRHNICSFIC